MVVKRDEISAESAAIYIVALYERWGTADGYRSSREVRGQCWSRRRVLRSTEELLSPCSRPLWRVYTVRSVARPIAATIASCKHRISDRTIAIVNGERLSRSCVFTGEAVNCPVSMLWCVPLPLSCRGRLEQRRVHGSTASWSTSTPQPRTSYFQWRVHWNIGRRNLFQW